MTRRLLAPAVSVLLLTGLAACGSEESSSDSADDTAAAVETSPAETTDEAPGASSGAAGGECSPDSLETTTAGTLTWGTSDPAFEPWMVDNDPANGEGFESAVAAAVTEQLGLTSTEWVRGTFDTIIAPGPKDFDVAINQVSITDERRAAIDFSSSYYDARQAVIAIEGNPAASATSLAELADVRLGAAIGTTSLEAINTLIAPAVEAAAFNSNDDAKLALSNGQVDAIVVDLPTAFFLTAVELDGGVIVGQLPQIDGQTEQFGLVLDLDSPLTDCVSQAVDALREDGTLADLEAEWLSETAGAPELS